MNRLVSLAVLLILGFTAVGCVSQAAYDDLQSVNRTLEEQIVELKMQLEQARDQVRFLQSSDESDRASVMTQLTAAQNRAQRLEQQLAAAQAALDEAEGRFRNLPTGPGSVSVLPAELDQQLKNLAAQNPGLMTYDPELGMVQLKSDLTFNLGSADVSDEAQQALQRLSRVLQTSAAQPYEIRVVGHTDNVPVRNPANVRKYGDNWGLSVARAIAVKDVLQKAGIQPGRFLVAGYGEYHPLVPNGPRGARENRRVEIYLFKSRTPATRSNTSGSTTSQGNMNVEEVQEVEEVQDEPVMYK